MAIITAYQTAESGKFKQFPLNDTNYPAISVTRVGYYDRSSAFPGNTGTPTYSAVDVYPKYAVLTHLTNASDITVSLSASDINVNLSDVENLVIRSNTLLNTISSRLDAQLGQGGFNFIIGGQTTTGNFTTVQIVSAAKISAISASSSTVGQLTAFELPVNFSFNGPITSLTLLYGAAFVYKL
jgi:hypothetical protein